ncbi:MAG: ATP-binding cassette domain-containing protein [Gemmataceae bacterium]
MQISIRYPVRPRRRTLAAATAADLFGLDEREEALIIADQVELDIKPGDLILFIGPSGSGKSSLLREVTRQMGAVDVNTLELPDVPLVDGLPGPVADRLARLSACGLAEARLALRTPSELSDGQRARFRSAFAMTLGRPLAIDEFAAMLDRPLARVLAYNLRRAVTRSGNGALVATTHEDLTEELDPDVIVRYRGEGDIEVTRFAVKKKRLASRKSFGSRTAPVPTGRTSLGGITAATPLGSPSASLCCGNTPSRLAFAYLPHRPPASLCGRSSLD